MSMPVHAKYWVCHVHSLLPQHQRLYDQRFYDQCCCSASLPCSHLEFMPPILASPAQQSALSCAC